MDKLVIYNYVECQKINHDKFGTGIVTDVEKRTQYNGKIDDQPIVYVKFENDTVSYRVFNGLSLHEHEVQ